MIEEPKETPILGIKCAKCGAVYMVHSLDSRITTNIAENISYSVCIGDIPFISYGDIKLSPCSCNYGNAEPETEG